MDIHIHVPEGAVPKDGPSAGVTITTSLVSALTGIPVRKDIAMTGEISLRGKVLPIGGLKEKLLAAKRAEMKTVLIPHENLKDLEEVPDEITNGLEILPMKHVDEVLRNALCRFPDSVQDPLEEEKAESENNEVINQEDLSTVNPSLPS
jgi:ATP-dependent Lon protease